MSRNPKAREKRIGRSIRRLYLGETKSIGFKVAKEALNRGWIKILGPDLEHNPNKEAERPNQFCELTELGKQEAKKWVEVLKGRDI